MIIQCRWKLLLKRGPSELVFEISDVSIRIGIFINLLLKHFFWKKQFIINLLNDKYANIFLILFLRREYFLRNTKSDFQSRI